MIIEALSQLVSGNLFWFVEIVLNNLHWAFALFAFTVFFLENFGYHYRNFIFLVGSLWAIVSIADIFGMLFYSAGIFLLMQLVLKIFWPDWLMKKRPMLQIYIIWIGFVGLSLLLTLGIIGNPIPV